MPETKPTLRREQIAGMNIHYIMWSLDYFLDTQQRLGFESIELWCAEPHVTLDHTGYFEAEVLAKKGRRPWSALSDALSRERGLPMAVLRS